MSTRRTICYLLPMVDATEPVNAGEGITRTSSRHSRLFPVRVHFQHAKPLLDSIRAVSKAQAKTFAKNRYPTQVRIELL